MKRVQIFLESDIVPGVTTGIFHWPTLSLSWPFIDFNITAEEGIWQKQETHKGVEPIAGTLRGGWGFNCWYETAGGEPVQMYYTATRILLPMQRSWEDCRQAAILMTLFQYPEQQIPMVK